MRDFMPHFIYILESKDGRYYTGYTTDLKRRMDKHKKGTGAKFTRGFGFKKLLYHETHSTKSLALKREAEIKGMTRQGKKALILPGLVGPRFRFCSWRVL